MVSMVCEMMHQMWHCGNIYGILIISLTGFEYQFLINFILIMICIILIQRITYYEVNIS